MQESDTCNTCSLCQSWDKSPEAKRQRLETLRNTIPAEVLSKASALKVKSAGVSPAKFVGRIRDFDPPATFDDALFHVANTSALGIMCGFIAFSKGGRISFECNAFKQFNGPSTSKKKKL